MYAKRSKACDIDLVALDRVCIATIFNGHIEAGAVNGVIELRTFPRLDPRRGSGLVSPEWRLKMKSYILFAAIILSTSAMAKEPWEGDFPSLEEQFKQGEEINFKNVLWTMQNDEDFAGTYSQLSFRGQQYIVDRRTEPVSKKPGAQPGGAARIAGFVNSLSAEARGSVRISVSYTFNADGSIASENWQLDFQGSWQSSAGFEESKGKYHR